MVYWLVGVRAITCGGAAETVAADYAMCIVGVDPKSIVVSLQHPTRGPKVWMLIVAIDRLQSLRLRDFATILAGAIGHSDSDMLVYDLCVYFSPNSIVHCSAGEPNCGMPVLTRSRVDRQCRSTPTACRLCFPPLLLHYTEEYKSSLLSRRYCLDINWIGWRLGEIGIRSL